MSPAPWDHAPPTIRRARLRTPDGPQDVAVVAPLTDAHVHLGLAPLPSGGSATLARVLDLGGNPSDLDALGRRAEDAGGRTEIRWAGAFLTAPGGYPSTRGWAPEGSVREVLTPAKAAAAAEAQIDGGAAVIKVVLNSDAGPVPDADTLDAVVASAGSRGVRVVAHAEGRGQSARALEAGVDVLAHTPWTERLDDELVAAMAERMVWISTLDMHRRDDDQHAWDRAADNLHRFLLRGGRVLYGTDMGNGLDAPELHAPEAEALIGIGRGAGASPEHLLAAFTGSPLLPARATTVSVLPAGVEDAADALAALPESRPVPLSALEEPLR
ncbi:MAG: hypothetical protein Q4F53_06460 [Nesterenkonia sp.]|nr:hypothetical protein [Nesterenkonia sp.]